MEKYELKIKTCSILNYITYDEYAVDIDEYEKIDSVSYENDNANLKNKLKYYEEEYLHYVRQIGYELNDQSQNETLFNLLNNGLR